MQTIAGYGLLSIGISVNCFSAFPVGTRGLLVKAKETAAESQSFPASTAANFRVSGKAFLANPQFQSETTADKKPGAYNVNGTRIPVDPIRGGYAALLGCCLDLPGPEAADEPDPISAGGTR